MRPDHWPARVARFQLDRLDPIWNTRLLTP